MTEKKVNAVPRALIDSFQETNQAISETIVAAQERNIQFAQSTLVNAMEIFKNHMEGTRALMKELEQQSQKQLEAFQQLEHRPEDAYTDFFRAPFSYYQQFLATAETATRQGLESFQKAIEDFQKAAEQGRENFEKAAQQAQRAAYKAKE
jgi:hypothetical protein